MSVATRVEWEDLLSVPFMWGGDSPEDGGIDCYGVARTICKRAGLFLPEIGRGGDVVIEDWLADEEHHAEFLGEAPTGRWRRAKYRVGDILLSDANNLGCASHASVFVDMNEMLALTSFEGHGCVALPAWKMPPSTYGVWRPAPL